MVSWCDDCDGWWRVDVSGIEFVLYVFHIYLSMEWHFVLYKSLSMTWRDESAGISSDTGSYSARETGRQHRSVLPYRALAIRHKTRWWRATTYICHVLVQLFLRPTSNKVLNQIRGHAV